MSEQQKRITSPERCDHCDAIVSMQVIADHKRVKVDDEGAREAITVFELLLCPRCNEVTLRRSRDHFVSKIHLNYEHKTLYPESEKHSTRWPLSFQVAYAATLNYRNPDPVAYQTMMGHLGMIRECNRKKRI